MNLSKSYEYFKPTADRIHIIGCGSVGSTIAENLARLGVTKMTLYDFDTVEPHNIANQMFRDKDIGKLKVEAVRDIITEINPDAKDDIAIEPKGWNGKPVSGIAFLAVDTIELRRKFVETNMDNPYLKAVFDIRTGLEDAQHFAADWSVRKQKENLLKGMQFSHEDAMEATPMSACGMVLGVAPTVRVISAYAVANYVNFANGKPVKNLIMADSFSFTTDAY